MLTNPDNKPFINSEYSGSKSCFTLFLHFGKTIKHFRGIKSTRGLIPCGYEKAGSACWLSPLVVSLSLAILAILAIIVKHVTVDVFRLAVHADIDDVVFGDVIFFKSFVRFPLPQLC